VLTKQRPALVGLLHSGVEQSDNSAILDELVASFSEAVCGMIVGLGREVGHEVEHDMHDWLVAHIVVYAKYPIQFLR
jgi:hypothetical protein